ncbi:MAG: phenylalanine--tRNA ligase subunit alpha [Alphaproteobacteria bacterium]|nr:phenylalanine--tRNA ligase subunit alpha [Alphaproteobacteria bacterium]
MAEAARPVENTPISSGDLDALKTEFAAAVAAADSIAALDDIRVSALGKKGRITDMMKTLGSLPPDERKNRGAALNVLKDEIAAAIDARHKILADTALAEKLARESIDVTLAPRPAANDGRVHPISQTIDELVTIFASMGFSVAKGPDIESEYYNFEALNLPSSHPARDMQATFFLPGSAQAGGDKMVLRTQTSPVQIRTMKAQKPPIRIIAPGRTYRCDYDMTHTPMFHQIEGLVIDQSTHMGHLKGCLLDFMRAFFGIDDLPIRFRPSYFPFTEPSAEIDIGCKRPKGGKGELKLGNYGDWLEIGGCGMVHPNVLRNCGLDPDAYQGFAFGMGIERMAMLKYGIPDLRTFFDADLRWLKHYGFVPLDIPNPALKG